MEVLSTIPGIVLIILGFGVLIFVHELGHFVAAKWAGIRTHGFAIGMGPVLASWRQGIGLALGSTDRKVVALAGKPAADLSDEELEKHGLGETEYSLRWLPIGGFVKMLGQEDANPTAVSDDPRSYSVCPIGKRMIVVSAGVVMNVILAFILFIIAFLAGVRFEAPVIGDIDQSLPAGTTMADNADELGVTAPGMRPGDEVVEIDGRATRTFADIQIAAAMAKPQTPVEFLVQRRGVDAPLRFTMMPKPSEMTGLLSIGVHPGRSSRLYADDDAGVVEERLRQAGLHEAGVRPGMRLASIDGVEVSTWGAASRLANASDGRALSTRWTSEDENGTPAGTTIEAPLTTRPLYARLIQPGREDEPPVYDYGLLGLSPLTRIEDVRPGSPNLDVLLPDDVILRADTIDYPRWSQMRSVATAHVDGEFDMTVLRDGEMRSVRVTVNRHGRLEISLGSLESMSATASVVPEVVAHRRADEHAEARTTPAAAASVLAGSRIDAVDDVPVSTWPELRAALRARTVGQLRDGEGAVVSLGMTSPTPGREQETVALTLNADDVRALHALGWATDLESVFFEPIYRTLSAGGSPVRAVTMGFAETHKLIMLTYLTIDRLIRGSVGVEQLHGPVGIIDLGAKILPKGIMYFIFFLGMISVNLAVINFLPLPIVDGGLFLFLVYEKLRGRPPSVQFQNFATIVGLFLIGTVFVVTFYNDIARLIG